MSFWGFDFDFCQSYHNIQLIVITGHSITDTYCIPPDLSIDLTASIVSCQSCVVYTTFVGNSVLSFTTSKLIEVLLKEKD